MASEEAFHNNNFEILMNQLGSACPPGFLSKNKKEEEEEEKEKKLTRRRKGRVACGNRPSIDPIEVPHGRSASFEKRPPISPRFYQTTKQQQHFSLQQRIGANRGGRYTPPTSASSTSATTSSSTISTSAAGFTMMRKKSAADSPRAIYVPPNSPTFERQRSLHQPRNYSRRLYIFNIPKDLTEEQLREYFSKFGALTSCGFEDDVIEEDSSVNTKRGFISYEQCNTTNYVLENAKDLKLGGADIRVRRATSQKTQLFVGGYDLYTTKSELIGFFSKYGEVCDFVMKYDSEGVSRCFGFVTLRDSEDAVNMLVEERFLECLGKTVEIKRATKTKRPFISYGGTPMAKGRIPVSPRFSRESLESFTSRPSLSPRGSFSDRPVVHRNLSTSSNDYDSDVPIDGTRMYSRKFFAPVRPGMKSSKSNVD